MSFDLFAKKKENGNSNLIAKIESVNKKKEWTSEYYYPTIDAETGKASVIIRFLPSKDPNNDLPFVTRYSHGFKGDDDRWCIVDMCPTTLGLECPVCHQNSLLWATNDQVKQDIVRVRKRKQKYIFNILIVKDSARPELEGTVQPYSAGIAIYNKILQAMKPEFEGQKVKDPFDIYEGYNFHLNLFRDKSKGNQISYDSCFFADSPTAICDGDQEKMKAVYESMVNLTEKYLDPASLENETKLQEKVSRAYCSHIATSVGAASALIHGTLPEQTKQEKVIKEPALASMDETPWDPNNVEMPWDSVPEKSDAIPDEDDEWLKDLSDSFND